MTQVCHPNTCIDAIRFALVDACTGVAIPGASNGYATDKVLNVTWGPNVEDGDVTTLTNDCGVKLFTASKCDIVNYFNLAFDSPVTDWELASLLTGFPLILDGGGDSIGLRYTDRNSCSPYLTVELFSRIPAEECVGTSVYTRVVLPKVRFKPFTNDKEDIFQIRKWEAKAFSAPSTGYNDGPFDDSPVDFSTAPATERMFAAEFDDTLTSVTVQCGFLPIAAQP